MGLDLGYKVDVAAIPIEILSKFPLSPLQNALEHCHDRIVIHCHDVLNFLKICSKNMA